VDAEIRITDPSQMQAFIEQEEQMIRDMVNSIVDTGANVLFCQKGIDDLAQHYLAKAGVLAVRRVKKSDMEKLSKATGANIVTNIEDLGEEDLGEAGVVSEKKISDEVLIVR
jgi:chaperonin GroEL (HSP60 family)